MSAFCFAIVTILRDEALRLPRLVKSCQSFLDAGGEFHAFDTGSTDNTVEVAKKLGIKIVSVGSRFLRTIRAADAKKINETFLFEKPLESSSAKRKKLPDKLKFLLDLDPESYKKHPGNPEPLVKAGDQYFHFGQARNAVAELSKKRWVLHVDGSQSFETFDFKLLNECLLDAEKKGFDRVSYSLRYFEEGTDGFQLQRVQRFYEKSELHWNYAVHEVVVRKPGCERTTRPDEPYEIPESVLLLHHYKALRKGRNMYLTGLAHDALLQPKDKRVAHYFGRELLFKGYVRSALVLLIELGNNPKVFDHERSESCCLAGQGFEKLMETEKALEMYRKGYEVDPTRRNPLLHRCRLLLDEHKWEAALQDALLAQTIPRPTHGYHEDAANYGFRVPQFLTHCYLELHQYDRAYVAWKQFRDICSASIKDMFNSALASCGFLSAPAGADYPFLPPPQSTSAQQERREQIAKLAMEELARRKAASSQKAQMQWDVEEPWMSTGAVFASSFEQKEDERQRGVYKEEVISHKDAQVVQPLEQKKDNQGPLEWNANKPPVVVWLGTSKRDMWLPAHAPRKQANWSLESVLFKRWCEELSHHYNVLVLSPDAVGIFKAPNFPDITIVSLKEWSELSACLSSEHLTALLMLMEDEHGALPPPLFDWAKIKNVGVVSSGPGARKWSRLWERLDTRLMTCNIPRFEWNLPLPPSSPSEEVCGKAKDAVSGTIVYCGLLNSQLLQFLTGTWCWLQHEFPKLSLCIYGSATDCDNAQLLVKLRADLGQLRGVAWKSDFNGDSKEMLATLSSAQWWLSLDVPYSSTSRDMQAWLSTSCGTQTLDASTSQTRESLRAQLLSTCPGKSAVSEAQWFAHAVSTWIDQEAQVLKNQAEGQDRTDPRCVSLCLEEPCPDIETKVVFEEKRRTLAVWCGPTHPYFASELYGSEIALQNLVKWLALEQGWNVVMFFDSPTPCSHVYNVPNLNVSVCPADQLVKQIQFWGIDRMIVWRYTYILESLPLEIKYVWIWLHDWCMHTYPRGNVSYPVAVQLSKAGIRIKVVTLTEIHLRSAKHRYPELPSMILPNGIAEENWTAAEELLRKRGLERVPWRFVWTSCPTRNLSYMLALWPKIRARWPMATLRVVRGDQHLEPDLRATMVILKDQGVTYVGQLPEKEVALELLCADIWLYMTHFPETFCMSALEAARAGCICVSTPDGVPNQLQSRIPMFRGKVQSPDSDEEILSLLANSVDSYPRKENQTFAKLLSWKNIAKMWAQEFEIKEDKTPLTPTFAPAPTAAPAPAIAPALKHSFDLTPPPSPKIEAATPTTEPPALSLPSTLPAPATPVERERKQKRIHVCLGWTPDVHQAWGHMIPPGFPYPIVNLDLAASPPGPDDILVVVNGSWSYKPEQLAALAPTYYGNLCPTENKYAMIPGWLPEDLAAVPQVRHLALPYLFEWRPLPPLDFALWAQSKPEKTHDIYLPEIIAHTYLSGHTASNKYVTAIKASPGYDPSRVTSNVNAARFALIVDPSVEPGYMTQLFMDALMALAVPVYIGAPDCDNYFSRQAVIALPDDIAPDKLCEIFAAIKSTDYEQYLPYLEAERHRLMNNLNPFLQFARALEHEELPANLGVIVMSNPNDAAEWNDFTREAIRIGLDQYTHHTVKTDVRDTEEHLALWQELQTCTEPDHHWLILSAEVRFTDTAIKDLQTLESKLSFPWDLINLSSDAVENRLGSFVLTSKKKRGTSHPATAYLLNASGAKHLVALYSKSLTRGVLEEDLMSFSDEMVYLVGPKIVETPEAEESKNSDSEKKISQT